MEEEETNIYVGAELFNQCRYILLDIPIEDFPIYDDINSIDELAQFLEGENRRITPETEFWGHCSNLQAWTELNYDTRILHSNIAFPLLRELTKLGDPIALRVYKEEIFKRIESNYRPVIEYLVIEGFLGELSINFIRELYTHNDILKEILDYEFPEITEIEIPTIQKDADLRNIFTNYLDIAYNIDSSSHPFYSLIQSYKRDIMDFLNSMSVDDKWQAVMFYFEQYDEHSEYPRDFAWYTFPLLEIILKDNSLKEQFLNVILKLGKRNLDLDRLIVIINYYMSKSENESAHIRSDLVDVIEKIFEIKLMNMRTKYKRILLLKHLDEDELFNIFKSEPNVILTLKEVINSGIAFEYLSHYKNPEIRIVDLLRPLENKVFKNEIFLKKFKEEGNTNQLEELVECYEKFIDPLKKSDQPTTLENENERFIHLENDIKEYMKNSPELNGYFLRIKNLLKTDSKQGVLELYIIKWVAVKNSFEKILEKVNEIETSYDIKLPNIKFND